MQNKVVQLGVIIAVMVVSGFVIGRNVSNTNATYGGGTSGTRVNFRGENMHPAPVPMQVSEFANPLYKKAQLYPVWRYGTFRDAAQYGYTHYNARNRRIVPTIPVTPIPLPRQLHIPQPQITPVQHLATNNFAPVKYPNNCTDSDDNGKNNGNDIYTKGMVTDGRFVATDYCRSTEYVVEYFCKNNNYRLGEFFCLHGCSDGACQK